MLYIALSISLTGCYRVFIVQSSQLGARVIINDLLTFLKIFRTHCYCHY